MSSEGTLSAVGDGWPLGQLTSPLVLQNVAPEMRPPLDLSVLDKVDGAPLSPKSKKLRDAQKLEHTRIINEAKGLIAKA